MGSAAQVQGVVFNYIKTGIDIEVRKMRMQLRLNQFRSAKRVAPRRKCTKLKSVMQWSCGEL